MLSGCRTLINYILIQFLFRKYCVLAGWLFFAPLLNHDVCHPKGFENSSSVFIEFVGVYLSIFNLYDNVGAGRI